MHVTEIWKRIVPLQYDLKPIVIGRQVASAARHSSSTHIDTRSCASSYCPFLYDILR
jgi:hypothetical protein